jgi:hypothetical protein
MEVLGSAAADVAVRAFAEIASGMGPAHIVTRYDERVPAEFTMRKARSAHFELLREFKSCEFTISMRVQVSLQKMAVDLFVVAAFVDRE